MLSREMLLCSAQTLEKLMLHRKINQICNDEKEVCIFLRDQQRWIENALAQDILSGKFVGGDHIVAEVDGDDFIFTTRASEKLTA